ncbi:hypothetical protein KY306_02895 [Candidatus Woesearchaeota archaeon]|nr:hypothetical protein [Candidatus Woesearchaeota archaeon]
MVNQQLITYIKNQLAQGYNINSIKLNLARSGYMPEQIEEAVGMAYGRPTKNLAKILLLVGGGAVILAALITTLILLLAGGEEIQAPTKIAEKEVGLDILLDKEVLLPGEPLKFEVKVINLGSGSNFGVNLRSEVLDDNEVVVSKDDTLTLRTQEKRNYALDLNLGEGSYVLKTKADYAGNEKEKTIGFEISEVGAPMATAFAGIETLTGEAVRAIEDIKQIADTEPLRAKDLCLGLVTVLEKDTCLLQTGLKLNREDFCVSISDNDKRDSCYVNIALALHNYALCNNVVNQNLKDACLALG